MRYEIKYHDISGDWLIFDMGDSFELVGIFNNSCDHLFAPCRHDEFILGSHQLDCRAVFAILA